MAETDLLTVEDRVALLVNALVDERDPFPVVKLFTPDAGATWLLTECDPDEPDRFFGLCDLGLGCPEIGYVSLTEIMSIPGPLGLPVERDLHFVACKSLTTYADEARIKGRIVA
ncbi:hypothetical protein NB311A_04419 [Nitrobacter sp. Nb-311A]|uniref:DUF2958 domain-containing protein n=1 Tax=Nitrobacter sp. Nb-311A TaxID=314253 RepID=UPI0000686402|nr:DUF2958 domain-containing protein [Nitrobacter sp. Nb-311A]EAQ37525.1 hypothetical protein NB311A_04419 [Nitrobacter sp. Nb-311A]